MFGKTQIARWLRRYPLLRKGLNVGVRFLAPRHYVGAVGAVFDDAGQVLLVEHVFRPDYPWGLPGGWVEPGEDPADTVRRELTEELGLEVVVKELLFCEVQQPDHSTPLGLGLAFYCRLLDDPGAIDLAQAKTAYEVLAIEWVDPSAVGRKLVAAQAKAIKLGRAAFTRDVSEPRAIVP